MTKDRIEAIGKTKRPVMIWVLLAGLLLAFGIGYVTGCRYGQKQVNAMVERVYKNG